MPFNPGALLDTLRTYPERSATLGWLDGPNIQRSLEAKLDNARRQLGRDNREAAAGVLRALANEVESQRDKALSSKRRAAIQGVTRVRTLDMRDGAGQHVSANFQACGWTETNM